MATALFNLALELTGLGKLKEAVAWCVAWLAEPGTVLGAAPLCSTANRILEVVARNVFPVVRLIVAATASASAFESQC